MLAVDIFASCLSRDSISREPYCVFRLTMQPISEIWESEVEMSGVESSGRYPHTTRME